MIRRLKRSTKCRPDRHARLTAWRLAASRHHWTWECYPVGRRAWRRWQGARF